MITLLTKMDCYIFNLSNKESEIDFIITANKLKKERSNKILKIKIGRILYVKISDIESITYDNRKIDYQVLNNIETLTK